MRNIFLKSQGVEYFILHLFLVTETPLLIKGVISQWQGEGQLIFIWTKKLKTSLSTALFREPGFDGFAVMISLEILICKSNT